jgi:hypothetical protein
MRSVRFSWIIPAKPDGTWILQPPMPCVIRYGGWAAKTRRPRLLLSSQTIYPDASVSCVAHRTRGPGAARARLVLWLRCMSYSILDGRWGSRMDVDWEFPQSFSGPGPSLALPFPGNSCLRISNSKRWGVRYIHGIAALCWLRPPRAMFPSPTTHGNRTPQSPAAASGSRGCPIHGWQRSRCSSWPLGDSAGPEAGFKNRAWDR